MNKRSDNIKKRIAALNDLSIKESDLENKAKVPAPIKQNEDYDGNFLDKIKRKNKLRRRIKKKTSKEDSPYLLLKAASKLSGSKIDIYTKHWLNSNPEAKAAMDSLNIKVFAEYYFGTHYVDNGIADKLEEEYLSLKNKE